jgi:hypothetical protein
MHWLAISSGGDICLPLERIGTSVYYAVRDVQEPRDHGHGDL